MTVREAAADTPTPAEGDLEDREDPGSPGTGNPVGRFLTDHTTAVVAIVVLIGVGVGLLLRVRYYLHIEPGPDSDEAEFGLLAQQLLRGELPLLMRGQPYGGTPWLFAIATSMKVFGMNAIGLRIPTVFLGLANAGLAFGIGRQLGWTSRRSALGAVGVWCYPMAAVYFASRETMYFVPSITCGLIALFVITRMEARREPSELLGAGRMSQRGLFVAGIAAGIGLWINPGSFYLTGPTFAWIGWRVLRQAWELDEPPVARLIAVVRPAFLAGAGVVVGAFPWLFLTLLGQDRRNNYEDRVGYGLGERAELFFRQQLPGWMGFKTPLGGYLEGAWLGGVVWKVGFVAVFLLVVFQIARRGTQPNERVLTALGVGVPVVFLIITAQSGPVYANLRYVFFASPILGLLMASKWRTDLQAAAAVLVLPLVALAGMHSFQIAQGHTVAPTVRLLEQRGAECAIGDYWAGGHRLMFESEGEIVAISTYENRNPLYVDQADAIGDCPWVFGDGSPGAAQFEAWMAEHGVTYEAVRPRDGLVVYFPDRNVPLGEVFPDEAIVGG